MGSQVGLRKLFLSKKTGDAGEVHLTSTSSHNIFANSRAPCTQWAFETVYDSRILNTTQCSCDQKLDKLPNTQQD